MLGVGAALSAPGVLLAAADATSGGFDLSQIVTAGVTPALVLLLVLTGKLYPSGIVESYKQRTEHAETLNEALQTQMLGDVVPALTLSTQAVTQLTPVLAQLAPVLAQLTPLLLHTEPRDHGYPPRPRPSAGWPGGG